MSDFAWIMTGFGTAFGSTLFFILVLRRFFCRGWGLVHSVSFLAAGISAGIAMMFYGKSGAGIGMYVCIFIGLAVIVYNYGSCLKKTWGMSKEESERFMEEQNALNRRRYLVRCDSVRGQEDGCHYTFTIVRQEGSTYYSGIMTMTSDVRFLEPGKVYLFDEGEMIKLGKDRYASLNEGGADITGVPQSAFIEGNKSHEALMNTVANVMHKQEYGTYEEGTVYEKADKVTRKVNHVKGIVMAVIIAVVAAIALMPFINTVTKVSKSVKKISDNETKVTALIEDVNKLANSYEYTLKYTYDGKDCEAEYTWDTEREKGQTLTLFIDKDNPGKPIGITTASSGSMTNPGILNSLAVIMAIVFPVMTVGVMVFAAVLLIKKVKK